MALFTMASGKYLRRLMEILTILGLSFVGAVFWVLSTEGLAMYYGALGWHPALVGLLCSIGQNANYVVLYFGGKTLIERWTWLREKVGIVEDRYHSWLRQGYLITTFIASLVGLPPVVAMVALAPGFHIRLPVLLTVTLVGRFIRFTVLALSGEALLAWWAAL